MLEVLQLASIKEIGSVRGSLLLTKRHGAYFFGLHGLERTGVGEHHDGMTTDQHEDHYSNKEGR